VPKNVLVIDAVFGSGLNRPPDDLSKLVIDHLNACGNEVIHRHAERFVCRQ
jgi:NAD(P)H-hydrate epimerase